jgi:hypothetical protein
MRTLEKLALVASSQSRQPSRRRYRRDTPARQERDAFLIGAHSFVFVMLGDI